MEYIARSKGIECEKFEGRKIVYINNWFWRINRSGGDFTTKLAPGNPIYKVYNGHKRKAKNWLSLFFTPLI